MEKLKLKKHANIKDSTLVLLSKGKDLKVKVNQMPNF